MKEHPRDRGTINPEFIKKHNLTPASHPADYANIFLPFGSNIVNGREYPSFQLLTKWTNIKASHAGAGEDGLCYKDFKPFTMEELRRHVGIYLWNGISPSPQIEMKFVPQSKDVVHGSGFIYSSFGPNAERRHRHFKVHHIFLLLFCIITKLSLTCLF